LTGTSFRDNEKKERMEERFAEATAEKIEERFT
jgi:hypothetical protein